MPRSMAPLKKPRNTTKLPLALNPLKSKDVLAVLAERNQAIVPVGAWVEPAPPDSSEVPAATSAYIIEEELKEQLRKKQEALKRFQRQVKSRVNQQIRLRKKQQLQRSYEAAEKEGSIAMYSSDLAHLTPKRMSVFPSNLNAAIGRARLPPPHMLEGGIEDRENQNELFQQQAQALSQSMKQARHRLASFKTVNQKDAPAFPDARKKSFPTQEKALCRKPSFTRINIGVRELPLEVHQGLLTPADYQKFMDDQEPEESSSVMIDKKGKKHLSWGDQETLLPEDKDIPFSRVQKVQFKTPLFDVMEEEEVKQLHQDVLPETQDYLPEAQGDLTSVLDVEWEAQRCEPRLSTQHIDLEDHTIEAKAQAIKTKTKSGMLKDTTVGLEDGDIALEVQDFPLQNQTFLPTDEHILPKDQNVLPKCQDQDFLPSNQKVCFKETYCDMMNEKGRKEFSLESYQYLPPKLQDQASIRDQSKCVMQPSRFKKSELGRGIASGVWLSLSSIQQPCVGTAEKWQEDLLLDGHQHLASKQQREASSRKQVGDEYQSRLNTEFQTPLALQSGVSQEEVKKERQKQYLRYRRLFMDIEREQVKEQQRQKEHKKKIEKVMLRMILEIKKKKEQQRYAEEQRILRMNSHEEPCSGEKMSEMLAQLQLEEVKGAREKQQQKEKEYQRYVEALRAQIQEKMQLYNITLPPLCCCGPDFWDAHPDTCANNCIFYKNHKAYTRALHSVINSCDIPEGNSDLRVAIHNFASAHRRTLKNL